ncbi:uncharacterized protein LOC128998440 [Macrosteles quadrilineatus]|uniref:uncharacterized protein LOC128998440 n=1 Tax=Macrosteles quadrilineatus TaxID=74068 RepID=UPI0023E2CC4B|nr:uncharacterized protein LOC128998440 [Macrosteles quadrilineatus]
MPNRLAEKQSVTLLGTLKLGIQDMTGQFKCFRALVDPGSQLSFITETCVRSLALPRQRYHLPIKGLSQVPVNATKGIVNCLLKPKHQNQPTIPATAVILEKITSPLPTCSISSEVREAFQNLDLADDEFDVPGPIDFLLGADLYPDIFDGGRLQSPTGFPTPYHSVFGWVLIGKAQINLLSDATTYASSLGLTSHLCTFDNNSLDIQLKQFWELEEFPKIFHSSDNDKFCEDHFIKNHTRDPDSGRYIVKLPFIENAPELGSSYQNATSRLRSLEKKLAAQPQLRTSYNAFMDEYLQLGHMRPNKNNDPPPQYFIPHHGILKESSPSTRFRTVFDTSAASSNGK